MAVGLFNKCVRQCTVRGSEGLGKAGCVHLCAVRAVHAVLHLGVTEGLKYSTNSGNNILYFSLGKHFNNF